MAVTLRPEQRFLARARLELAYAPGGIPIVAIPLCRNPFQDACRSPRPGKYPRKATSPAYTAFTQCTPRVPSEASLTVGRALATPANSSYRRRRSGSLKPDPTWPTTCSCPSGPRPANSRDPIRPWPRRTARWPPSHDREFARRPERSLDPILRTPRNITGVNPFRHNSFNAVVCCGGEHVVGIDSLPATAAPQGHPRLTRPPAHQAVRDACCRDGQSQRYSRSR